MESVINQVIEIMKYGFIHRAIIAGIFTALSCSILGVFLVLKKFSFLGDGLAHVSFFSAALALLLHQSPLIVSLPIVVGASLIILKLSERAAVYGDSAIALVASTSIALGVIIASISKGFNVDLFGYLFGSILTITTSEVILSVLVSVIIISVIILFYNEMFLSAFDEDFSLVTGLNPGRVNYIISIISAVTIVIGIKIVGTMLISSLIIFPAVTALQISRGFRETVVYSAVIGVLSVVLGLLISLLLEIPTGAAIVVMNGLFFLGAFFIKTK